ncbi:MAG: hypothetical protein NC337_04070 [Roseburia sp.]|nr:hypothetical protein [Roseburia sp.]
MKTRKRVRALSAGLAGILILTMLPAQELAAAQQTKAGMPWQMPVTQEGVSVAEESAIEEIVIRNVEDFLAFAENCHIDSWSANKRIVLEKDIDLSGTDFRMIPVFAGTFDGLGHTISGYENMGNGYVVGLFRYIERDGVVQNLKLKGNIEGAEEKECIGSFCGVNYGMIKNCSFQGTVSGRDTVGGIAGVNEGTGTITGCAAGGRVTGYYMTGGIAGTNHGVITGCTNRAGINDDSEWVEEDDEMGAGIFFSITVSESDTELYSGVDTGGVAGYSDGLISRCTNLGKVGYEHTGYNIGGIAGRQAGVVSLCTNSGGVYGRKDVGGIVGQMEPYIEVNEAESLRDAVNRLHTLINKTIDDLQAGKNTVKSDLDNLNRYTDWALDSGDALAEQLTDFIDDNIGQTQAIAERMEYVMEQLPGIMQNTSDAGSFFRDLNDTVKQLSDHLDVVSKVDASPYEETDYRRVSLLSTVGGSLTCDSGNPRENDVITITAAPEAGYKLAGSPTATDANGSAIAVTAAGENVYTVVMPSANIKVSATFICDESVNRDKILLSSNVSGNASYGISGNTVTLTVEPDAGYILSGNPEVFDKGGKNVPVSKKRSDAYVYEFEMEDAAAPYSVRITFEGQNKQQTIDASRQGIKDDIKALQEASDRVQQSVKRLNELLTDADGNPREWGELTSKEQEEVLDEAEKLSEAVADMSVAASSVLGDLGVISNILTPYTSDAAMAAKGDIEAATRYVQSIIDSLKGASGGLRELVNYINAQTDIRFTQLGDTFDEKRERFHNQLKGISDSLKSLGDNASDYSDIINEDLRAVNDQINVVFNLLTDRLADYSEFSAEDLYEDMSDEEIETITTGRTDDCTNKGVVKGDINIGGIAGAMSIDDEDPEDSAAGSVEYRIGRRYVTQCVITGCVNEGYVTARKDGAGGIVGYMRHGVVLDSEGYGSVESTEGDYVGGICGESRTIIRRCYALCSVSGNKNVGGIAGYADTLKDCCAIVSVEAAADRKGAIAGQVTSYENTHGDEEEAAKVSGNYYVGDELCGVDDISYVGIAEPITYEELLTVENLPTAFRHLKVVYRIEDSYLGTQEVAFGESLAGLQYPQIPEREGYYGVWPDYTGEYMKGNLVINGEYRENVTVVESNEKYMESAETAEEYRRPYALVEQIFTEETTLKVGISDMASPEAARDKEHVIYNVTLENANIGDAETFAVRLLNPYEDAVVWGYRDGVWTQRESKARGQYLQVEMTGSREAFCVVEEKTDIRGFIAAGAAAAVVIALLVLIKKSRARRRKRKAARADDAEQKTP